MKYVRLELQPERIPLSRPYAVAGHSTDVADIVTLRLITSTSHVGVGAASPVASITGETPRDCLAALEAVDPVLVDLDLEELDIARDSVEALPESCPAARAALDMALCDLWGKSEGKPLVELWGRAHVALSTSITIGIKDDSDEVLAEAREYLDRGFEHIKLKLGKGFDADVECLRQLAELTKLRARLRVDVNGAYGLQETLDFFRVAKELEVELVEQPFSREEYRDITKLPAAGRRILALDESLMGVPDARELADHPAPAAAWVVKLMKCGGPTEAKALASLGMAADKKLMWGCMDESRVSIAAALHTAYASPATRWLDLDGHLDLSRDPARGGFGLSGGKLVLGDGAGLGVEL